MHIPVDDDVALPVSVLVPAAFPPRVARATLVRYRPDAVCLRTEDPDALAVGERVIVDGGPRLRLRARVHEVDGADVVVGDVVVSPGDARASMRLTSGFTVRYRTAGPALVGDAGWREPEGGPVDLSAAGVAFDDAPTATVGDAVLVEVVLGDDAAWTVRGRVVRVDVDDDGAHARVGVAFEDLPLDALVALATHDG